MPAAPPLRLLHLLPQIDAGGPTRGLRVILRMAATLGFRFEQRVATLVRRVYPPALAAMARAGVVPLLGPGLDALRREIAAADLVLLHYWNAPAWHGLLTAPLPPARMAVWAKMNGRHPPQRLLPAHGAFADAMLLTAPHPLFPQAEVIPGQADFSRLAALVRDDTGGIVSYIGNVTPAKLHPDFFALSDAIPGDGLRIAVAGGAIDAPFDTRYRATRRPERFEFHGVVEDIAPLLGRTSVFGYPLAPHTYASSDQAL